MTSPDPTLPARAYLAAHSAGALQFDETVLPWKFVIDPTDGRICGPVMVAALLASQHVLHLPEETDDPASMRVLLSAEQLDDDPPIADRWSIHHGEPQDIRWAAFWIDFAKWDGNVIDGDALMHPHPYIKDTPTILKELNADPARLKQLCTTIGLMRDVEAPVAVAVDPLGVNVRARFDIVRLPFNEEAPDAQTARDFIAAFDA